MNDFTYHHKLYNELNVNELHQILKLRQDVFIVEQNCAYTDIDGRDHLCSHLFATNIDNQVVACCRILAPGTLYSESSIGRVCSSRHVRGQKVIRNLMNQAITVCKNTWPQVDIKIMAQSYLSSFYESLGFIKKSEANYEDKIEHYYMILKN